MSLQVQLIERGKISNLKGKDQLLLIRQIPGSECARAGKTHNKDANHSEAQKGGIRRYKLRSVPVPANRCLRRGLIVSGYPLSG